MQQCLNITSAAAGNCGALVTCATLVDNVFVEALFLFIYFFPCVILVILYFTLMSAGL